MKEQSHKEEMSAALRGDFERLRERGVAGSLTPAVPAPAPTEDAPAGQIDESVEPDEPVGQAGPVEQLEPPREVSDPVDDAEPTEPGWLGRLFGR